MTTQTLKTIPQDELDYLLTDACKHNDIEKVIYLTSSKQLTHHANIFYEDCDAFCWATYYGYIDIIKFFLSSPLLKSNIDIHFNNDYPFRIACENNNLEMVQYYLTSPDLKEHADPYAYDHYGFRYACSNHHMDVIKYLCSIPTIYTPDLTSTKQQGFHDACQRNYLDLLQFLLSCPTTYGGIKVDDYDNAGWKEAVINTNQEILEYLYQFPEVKNSIKQTFENTGLLYLSRIIDSEKAITTFHYLLSLPETQSHFTHSNLCHLFNLSIMHNTKSLSEYILIEKKHMPSDEYIRKNKKKIKTPLIQLIKKIQLGNILEVQLENKDNHKTLKI